MSQPQRIEPTEADPPRRDRAVESTIVVLDFVFGAPSERTFDIRLWDGTLSPGIADPRADFLLDIKRRGTLRRMLLPPSELSIVESFISSEIEVEGNLESAIGLGDAIGNRIQSLGGIARLIPRVLALPRDDDNAALSENRYARSLRLLTPAGRKSTKPEI